jgi:hypothetical protein
MMHPACRARKAHVSWPVNIRGVSFDRRLPHWLGAHGESSLPTVVRYRAQAGGLCQWLGGRGVRPGPTRPRDILSRRVFAILRSRRGRVIVRVGRMPVARATRSSP